MLGIILSIILFSTVGYIQKYYNEFNILNAKARSGNYEAIICEVSNNEINKLRNNVYIDNLGLYKNIYNTYIEVEDIRKYTNIYALDSIALENSFSPNLELVLGRFPKNDEEIIIDNVDKYTLNVDIGDKLTLNNKAYTIVGVYNPQNSSNTYGIDIITYLDQSDNLETSNAAFTVKSTKNKDKIIREVIENLNINENRLFLNRLLFYYYGTDFIDTDYIGNENGNITFILYGIILILTTFLTYGSINVSVKERIKQFSILRCIGATPRKLRILLIKESIFLAIFSLIPGIILGQGLCFLISKLIIEKVTNINNYGVTFKIYLNVIIVTIILTLINIFIATIVPAIRIGKISPVDGVVNGGIVANNVKKRKSKLIRRVFGYDGELAYKNIRADNRNFIITTITSIIILTTFIVFTGYNSNVLYSYEIEDENSKDISLDIGIKYKRDYDDIFNEVDKYKNQIEDLGIVQDIFPRVYYVVSGIFEDVKLNKYIKENKSQYNFGEKSIKINNKDSVYSDTINLIIMNDASLNEILPNVESGKELTLNDFKDNGVLIANRTVMKNIINVSKEPLFQLNEGDKFTLLLKAKEPIEAEKELEEYIENIKNNSKEVTLEYLGSIDGNKAFGGNRYGFSNNTTLIVSKDFYENNKDIFIKKNNEDKYFIEAIDINFDLDIKKDINKEEAIGIIENYSNKIEANWLDNIKSNSQYREDSIILSSLIYLTLFLIMIIGGVNIINNRYISIKLRNKEIGTLLALGISKKRLKKILILEGVVQWFISTAASIILSYIGLEVLDRIFAYTSEIDIPKMPILAILFGSVMLFVINILGAYLPIRKLEYTNTTELIRNDE